MLFYEAIRLHMTNAVVKNLTDSNIAIVAFLTHTSDRSLLLNVSVFSPIKRHVAPSNFAKLVQMSQQRQGGLMD